MTAQVCSGQPRCHWVVDRPIQGLLAPCLAANLKLDGLEEARPTSGAREAVPDAWERWSRLPVVFVARFRRSSP